MKRVFLPLVVSVANTVTAGFDARKKASRDIAGRRVRPAAHADSVADTSHAAPSVDPNDDYHRYIGEAKKHFSGPITIARL